MFSDTYPHFRPGFALQRQPDGGFLHQPASPGSGLWMLTPLAEEVFLLCNGRRTLREILAATAARFAGADFNATESALALITTALERGVLVLADRPWPAALRRRGSTRHYRPTHMSIELTDGCNLRCRHCYRASSPRLAHRLPTAQLLAALDEMARAGVRSVELTGGEPTSHPDFAAILRKSLAVFDLTAVLTNGTLLNAETICILADAGPKAVVQLDLDGATAEQHEGLRGMPGSFAKALNNLHHLTARGVAVRVAMTVYPKNCHAVADTFALARRAGARWFACNPIIDVGRATPDLLLSEVQLTGVLRELERLASLHPGVVVTNAEIDRATTALGGNCGAGSRALVLEPTGTLRPCVLLNTGKQAYGNIHERSFSRLARRAPLARLARLPKPSAELCGECTYLDLCQGCILRPVLAWERARQVGQAVPCRWDQFTGLSQLLGIARDGTASTNFP